MTRYFLLSIVGLLVSSTASADHWHKLVRDRYNRERHDIRKVFGEREDCLKRDYYRSRDRLRADRDRALCGLSGRDRADVYKHYNELNRWLDRRYHEQRRELWRQRDEAYDAARYRYDQARKAHHERERLARDREDRLAREIRDRQRLDREGHERLERQRRYGHRPEVRRHGDHFHGTIILPFAGGIPIRF